MTIEVEEFIEIIAEFLEVKHVRATISNSATGGVVTGVSALIGGLLLGPRGLLVGASVGGLAAALVMKDEFVSLPSIIRNMNHKQKMKLYSKIVAALKKIEYNDIGGIAVYLSRQPTLQRLVLREVGQYISQEFNMNMLN